MRIDTQLTQKEYNFLKKESQEVLGLSGALFPPFLQKDGDYIEVCVHDSGGKFLEKGISENCEIIDDKIVLKPGQDLRDLNYNRGNFLVKYYFYRREGGADEVVLTKTIEGVSGVIYSGEPTLTGQPAGLFYIEDGKAYEGEEPTDNPQELNITEYKFFIDEISTSRTEVRIAPQNISNHRYQKQFENLYKSEKIYRSIKNNYPDNFDDLPPAVQDEILTQNPELTAEGGDIKFDNPQQENESALELSMPNRLSMDGGFRQEMKDGYLVVKDVYTLDSQNIPDAIPNEDWEAELPIPEAYIEVINLGDAEERNRVSSDDNPEIFPMSGRFIVKETATNKSLRGLDDIFTPTDGTQYHFDFGCGHNETTNVPFANHTYDTEGSYNITVTIMTPSFTSTVTDMYTLDLNNPAPLEGPGERGPELDTFTPVPMGEVNDNGEVVEPIVYRALSSALDGKIIGWDGTGEFQPMVNVGQWERYNAPDHPRVATTTARWYVQSGYRRYVGGTHFGGSTAGIELLRKLKPGSYEQPKVMDSNNQMVDGEPIDLLVTAEIINDLPVGPPITLDTFGGKVGEKPYGMGQPFYRGIPLADAPDLGVNEGDSYLSPFEQNNFGRHFSDDPDSQYHNRFYTKEFGSGNDDKSQIGLDEVLYESSGVRIQGVRTHQYKFQFSTGDIGGYIIVAQWNKHFGDEGEAGGYVWAPRFIIDPTSTINQNFLNSRVFNSDTTSDYESNGFIVGDTTYNPSNDYDSNTWRGRFIEDLTREVEGDNRYPKLRTDHQQALSETAGKQVRLIFRGWTPQDLLDGYGPGINFGNSGGYQLNSIDGGNLGMIDSRTNFSKFDNDGNLIQMVYDLEPQEPQNGESPVTFTFSSDGLSQYSEAQSKIVLEKFANQIGVTLSITNHNGTHTYVETVGDAAQTIEWEHGFASMEQYQQTIDDNGGQFPFVIRCNITGNTEFVSWFNDDDFNTSPVQGLSPSEVFSENVITCATRADTRRSILKLGPKNSTSVGVDVAIGEGEGSQHPDNQGNGDLGPGSNNVSDFWDLDYGFYLTKSILAGDTERVYLSPGSGLTLQSIVIEGRGEQINNTVQDGQDYYLDVPVLGGGSYQEEIVVEYEAI